MILLYHRVVRLDSDLHGIAVAPERFAEHLDVIRTRFTPVSLSRIVEDPEPTGPYGAKGVGEPALVGVAPAVRNAIANATGAHVDRLPMTPERVFLALRKT